MGKASSAKKVARAARAGGSTKQRNKNWAFPAGIAAIVIIGALVVFVARGSNETASAVSPVVGDHWHAYRDGEGPWGSREDEPGRGGWGRGAGFRLQSGDTRLEVRCSPDESMRACVEAATTLLDRARSSSNTSASTTPPAPPAPAAPPR